VEIADQPVVAAASAAATPTLEQFLASLRTAWQCGEVRPTSRRRETKKRGRRRPIRRGYSRTRAWFDAASWRTSRELFERLQAAHPETFPDGQLRTLQRRIKDWRRDRAHAMVFGAIAASPPTPVDEATGALHAATGAPDDATGATY
jgi:hypothetical protein